LLHPYKIIIPGASTIKLDIFGECNRNFITGSPQERDFYPIRKTNKTQNSNIRSVVLYRLFEFNTVLSAIRNRKLEILFGIVIHQRNSL
jgi:hypothetical protein